MNAQEQADLLDDSVRRVVIAEQFASEWLLVAENDYEMYSHLLQEAKEKELSALSDTLRQEWEYLTEQVTELVEESISPQAGLFIAQILKGQGSLPFDIIARRVMEMKAEVANV